MTSVRDKYTVDELVTNLIRYGHWTTEKDLSDCMPPRVKAYFIQVGHTQLA